MKDGVFILFCLLVIIGCTPQSTQVANIDYGEDFVYLDLTKVDFDKTITVDDILDDVRAIKLETTDSSLLGHIRHIVFGNDYIYVHDTYSEGCIAIFSQDGSFVKRLSKGNGPEDISYVADITFDEANNRLVVFQPPVVKFFTPDGHYISDFNTNLSGLHIAKYGDGYLFAQDPYQNKLHQYCIVRTDSVFQVKNVFPLDKVFVPYLTYNTFVPLNNNNLAVVQPFNPTVYKMSDTMLIPHCYLDFGDYLFATEDVHTLDDLKDEFVGEAYSFVGLFNETSNYQFYRVEKAHLPFAFIYYNTTTGKIRKGIDINESLTDLVCIVSDFAGTYDDYFVRCFSWDNCDYDYMMNVMNDNVGNLPQDVVDKVKNLKEDDNPLIILYKLKDLPADTIPE